MKLIRLLAAMLAGAATLVLPAAGPDGCALTAAGRRCGWPRAAGSATRSARRGCSRPQASSASYCARTWPCRPPKTSPAPWGR